MTPDEEEARIKELEAEGWEVFAAPGGYAIHYYGKPKYKVSEETLERFLVDPAEFAVQAQVQADEDAAATASARSQAAAAERLYAAELDRRTEAIIADEAKAAEAALQDYIDRRMAAEAQMVSSTFEAATEEHDAAKAAEFENAETARAVVAYKESLSRYEIAEGFVALDGKGKRYDVSSWGPVPRAVLEAAMTGEGVPPPVFLPRTDGVRLIYPGRRHSFWGPSETYKTFVAMLAAKSAVETGARVLFVDFEDDVIGFVERCRVLGIPDEWIGTSLIYVNPDEPLSDDGETWVDFAKLHNARPSFGLVILDGVTEAMALHGLNPYLPMDVATYQHRFVWDWSAATIEIDHTGETKFGQRAKTGQLGSIQKRAGLSGVSVEFVGKQRGGRGEEAVVKMYVAKDRPGQVRPHAPNDFFGEFHLKTVPGFPVEAYITPDAPSALAEVMAGAEAEEAEAERIRTDLIAWMHDHPGASQRELDVSGVASRSVVRAVAEELVRHGTARKETAGRGFAWFIDDGTLNPET